MTTATSSSQSTIGTPSQDRASFKDVKRDIEHLKDDVGDVAQSGIEAAQHGATATLDAGKKVAENVGEFHKALCKHVAEHPTSSMLIAVGIGAMASRFLPRH